MNNKEKISKPTQKEEEWITQKEKHLYPKEFNEKHWNIKF